MWNPVRWATARGVAEADVAGVGHAGVARDVVAARVALAADTIEDVDGVVAWPTGDVIGRPGAPDEGVVAWAADELVRVGVTEEGVVPVQPVDLVVARPAAHGVVAAQSGDPVGPLGTEDHVVAGRPTRLSLPAVPMIDPAGAAVVSVQASEGTVMRHMPRPWVPMWIRIDPAGSWSK